MPTNNLTTIIKHSFYWLLPVILLNVFTSSGLQASAVALPFQVQTELPFVKAPPSDAPFLGQNPVVAHLTATPIWPGLLLRVLPMTAKVVPQLVSVHPTTKSLFRFYGKAAPEALDAWPKL
jgi:hypothetical protein